MKKTIKIIAVGLLMVIMLLAVAIPVLATTTDEGTTPMTTGGNTAASEAAAPKENKALAAAIAIGLAAAFGTIGMGIAIAKSVEGISRQPEAEGKIRTMLMLGLVFIETVVIYALIVAILIIFVL